MRAAAALALLAVACGDADDAPVARGLGLVLTSTYETSALERFDLEAPEDGATPILIAAGDAVLRRLDAGAVVVNRGSADNLQILDADFVQVAQIALDGCGPHDAASLPDGRVLVTCYEDDALRVVDVSTRAVATVSLSEFADADGLPEMDQVLVAGDRAFVTVQNLDRDAGFAAVVNGGLVVLDAQTLEVEADWALPCRNPFTSIEQVGDELFVGCADFFAPTSSALAAVHMSSGAARIAVDGAALGGSPSSLRADPERARVLAAVAVSSPSDPFSTSEMRVVAAGLAGAVSIEHAAPGFSLSGIAVDASGRVYVGDRSEERTGVVVLPAERRIATTLPPVDIELY